MDKMGYPRGLVRYTTENALEGNPAHILRPRVLIYGSLILAVFVGLFFLISIRVPLEVDILRDRNALYHERSGGIVENVYTLKLVNMQNSPQTFSITAAGIPGLELVTQDGDVAVASGAVQEVPVRLRANRDELRTGSSKVSFTVKSLDNPDVEVTETGRFLGPIGR
jgi:polyferredoxin